MQVFDDRFQAESGWNLFLWSIGGLILTEENRILGEKLNQVPLCPPKVPHGLAWGVRSDRLSTNPPALWHD